jgi:hypothetical protein
MLISPKKPLVSALVSTRLFRALIVNFLVGERDVRKSAHDSVLRAISVLPFFDLHKLTSDNLLSVSNYLRNELTSLQHSILHLHGQYETTNRQLEETNRLRLSKLSVTDSMEVDDKGEGSSGSKDCDENKE